MPNFRLLHVSDLHVAQTPERLGFLAAFRPGFKLSVLGSVSGVSSHNRQMLQGLARLAHREAGSLDGVVVTGDIATTGSWPDLGAADDFLHTAHAPSKPFHTPLGEPTLNNARGVNVYFIPGNHDRYQGQRLFPANTAFDLKFQNTWKGGQSACEVDVLRKGGVALGLIGADLSLRDAAHVMPHNPFQIWGAGRVYPDVVTELERLTNGLRKEYGEAVAVVWLVHFPPKFRKQSPGLDLIDEDELVRAADFCGVKVILAGHTHSECRYTPGSLTEVLCAGTATEHRPPRSQEPRSVHLLDFDVDAGGGCVVTKTSLEWSDTGRYYLPPTIDRDANC